MKQSYLRSKLYTVRIILEAGDIFLVGTFIGRRRAHEFAKRAKSVVACKAVIEHGDHSLVSPYDFFSVIPS